MNNPIGKKIENFRKESNISLEELSERSGLPLDLLKKIEQDKEIPMLNYLIKIARALGTRIGTFLDDNNDTPCIVTKNSDVTVCERYNSSNTNNSLIFQSLAHNKKDRNMEPFIINLTPTSSEKKDNTSSHEGEEFIYVLDGEVSIKYGKVVYELKQGDSIYYDSAVPHSVYSTKNSESKILAVLYIV